MLLIFGLVPAKTNMPKILINMRKNEPKRKTIQREVYKVEHNLESVLERSSVPETAMSKRERDSLTNALSILKRLSSEECAHIVPTTNQLSGLFVMGKSSRHSRRKFSTQFGNTYGCKKAAIY